MKEIILNIVKLLESGENEISPKIHEQLINQLCELSEQVVLIEEGIEEVIDNEVSQFASLVSGRPISEMRQMYGGMKLMRDVENTIQNNLN